MDMVGLDKSQIKVRKYDCVILRYHCIKQAYPLTRDGQHKNITYVIIGLLVVPNHYGARGLAGF